MATESIGHSFMKTQLTIMLAILSAFILPSCKSAPDLTEDEVYTIINEIIADDSLYINRVCWKFQQVELTDEYRREFTKQDIAFSNRQRKLFENRNIKPGKLKWFKKGGKVQESTLVDTVCNQGILYHISFPVISIDRRKVLIEFGEDCNCMLGGQGGKDLYEKKNGRWTHTRSFDHWISRHEKLAGKQLPLAVHF